MTTACICAGIIEAAIALFLGGAGTVAWIWGKVRGISQPHEITER